MIAGSVVLVGLYVVNYERFLEILRRRFGLLSEIFDFAISLVVGVAIVDVGAADAVALFLFLLPFVTAV